MTYGKFCGQRVAPPKKKTHKITEEISCSLQHAEEIRRQNVRGMLQRWGFTACGKTWQNMFFFCQSVEPPPLVGFKDFRQTWLA